MRYLSRLIRVPPKYGRSSDGPVKVIERLRCVYINSYDARLMEFTTARLSSPVVCGAVKNWYTVMFFTHKHLLINSIKFPAVARISLTLCSPKARVRSPVTTLGLECVFTSCLHDHAPKLHRSVYA